MEFRTFQKQWGAEFISDDVVRFRVWAEGQKALTLRLAVTDVPMTAVGNGWFQADVPGVTHGTEYQFVLQDGMTVPDPASRAQARDVNGRLTGNGQGGRGKRRLSMNCTSARLPRRGPSGPRLKNSLTWQNWVLPSLKLCPCLSLADPAAGDTTVCYFMLRTPHTVRQRISTR